MTFRIFFALLAVLSILLQPFAAAADEGFIFRYKSGLVGPVGYTPDTPDGADYDITATFPGFVGEPLEYAVPIKPGALVARWRMDGGSLPAGLSFDGENGIVSGTPSRKETTHFVARGIGPDGNQSTDAGVTVEIFAARDYARKVDLYAHSERHFSESIVSGGQTVHEWVPEIEMPSWITATSELLQGTPPEGSEGVYGIALSGRNYVGEEIAFVYGTLTVEAGPTLAFVEDQLRHPSEEFGFSARVAKKMGKLSFGIEGDPLPSNLSFNREEGTLKGRIPTFSTTARLRFVARDIDGTVGYSNWFNVSTTDPDVALSEVGDRALVLGEFSSFRLTATDLSGEKTWTVKEGALPAGMTLDEASGTISGTPEQIERQEGIVVSVVTSDGGADESNPFAIEVFPAPILAETTPASIRINTDFATVPPSVTGAAAPLFSIAEGADVSPGLTLDSSTGVVSGRVAVAGNHSVPFVVTDADGRVSKTFVSGIEAFNPLSISFEASYNLPRMTKIAPITPSVPEGSFIPSPTNMFGTYAITGTLPDGLVFNAASGAISGTPTTEGVYGPFTVSVTDGSGETATSNQFSITIGPRMALEASVSKTSIPAFIPVAEYIAEATNAIGGVVWNLEEGTLPPGISLREDGRLVGKASNTGTYPGIVLKATDSEGSTALTEPFTLEVVPPEQIAFGESFSWTAGRHFSKQLGVRNSAGGTIFTVDASTPLPAGVSLSSDGILSGTVASPMTASVTVQVTDSLGRSSSGTLEISILPSMTMALDPEHYVPREVKATIQPVIENGIGQVTFGRTGSLPDGMSFNSVTGLISGVPTRTGEWSGIRITASDDAGNNAETSIKITVTERLPLSLAYDFSEPLVVNSSTGLPKLPQEPTNAIGEVTYSVGGTLPQGISFNPENGAFTGRPTRAGTFPGLTVTATDSEGQTAAFGPFTIVVSPAGELKVNDAERQVRKGAWMDTGPIAASNAVEPLTFTIMSGKPTGLTLINSDGSLQGSDAPIGSHVVQMKLTDGIGRTVDFKLIVHVVGDLAVSYSDTTMNRHSAGKLLPQTSNVIGTPRFALSGSLPAGLAFDPATGEISGTPTETGTFGNLSVSVTDEGLVGNSVTSAPFTIRVDPRVPLEIAYPSQNTVLADKAYALSPTVNNAVGSLSWSISGTLPAGLSFDSGTGRIEGVAEEIGSWDGIVVTATDSEDGTTDTATLAFSVQTDGLPIRLVTYDVKTKVGYPFKAQLPKVSNAIGDYYFISPDAESFGLSFDPKTGIVSGTVNEAARIVVNVRVTDTTNRLTSEPVVIEVIPNIRLTVREHIDVTVSSKMNAVVPVTDYAVGSVRYELFGTLPTGLVFNTSSGAISGTPTELGTFDGLYIKATDSIGDSTISSPFGITVHESGIVPSISAIPSTFTLTAGTTGMNYTVGWTPKKVGDVIALNNQLPEGIEFNPDTGQISGIPVEGSQGIYSGYVVSVTDAAGKTAHSNEFTIVVRPRQIKYFEDQTLTVRVGQPFESSPPRYDASAVTGKLSYLKGSWGATSVDLDAETGIISGTVPSTRTFVVIPTDETGNLPNFTITVTGTYPRIAYEGFGSIPTEMYEEFSFFPTLENVIGKTRFEVVSGSLPDGVNLDPDTGEISGQISQSGYSNFFTIRMTDEYGSAEVGSLRFNGQDTHPDPFSWTDVADADAENGSEIKYVYSEAVAITGFTKTLSVSFDDPTTTLLRCDAATCRGVTAISPGNYVYQLRTRPPAHGETKNVTVVVEGGVHTTTWSVTSRGRDEDPDPFHFVDVSDLGEGEWINSDAIQITGLQDPLELNVTGPAGTKFRVSSRPDFFNAGYIEAGTPREIRDGYYLHLRTQASADLDTPVTVTVTLGNYSTTWTVRTRKPSRTPVNLVFADEVGRAPNQKSFSGAVKIEGITGDVPVSISGDGEEMQWRRCPTSSSSYCSAWTDAPGTISENEYIQLAMNAHPENDGIRTMAVQVGDGSASWRVITRPLDTVPDAFTITNRLDVARDTLISSVGVRIRGIPDPVPVSVQGPAGTELCIQGSSSASGCSWRTQGEIKNDQYIFLRTVSSSDYDTPVTVVLTIGSVTAEWIVKTYPHDETPDPIPFVDRTNYAPNAEYPHDFRLTGIFEPVEFSLSSNTSARLQERYAGSYYRDFTGNQLSPGKDYRLFLMTGANGETATAILRVGTETNQWSITARPLDEDPDPFTFGDYSGASPNQEVPPKSVTIRGVPDPVPISISGPAGALYCAKPSSAYSCYPDDYTSEPGTVMNGWSVRVKMRASPSYSTSVHMTVTVGNYSTVWTVTTRAAP